MKREKKESLAKQLINLEHRYQETKDSNILIEIEKIALSLSMEDMFELDEYILEKYKNF